MRNLNELSNDRQMCLVPDPNSKSSAISGRSFSLTQSGLCVSVSLNREATTVTIQRGNKLGYALPLNTDFQIVENLKKFDVTKCPLHFEDQWVLVMQSSSASHCPIWKSLFAWWLDFLKNLHKFSQGLRKKLLTKSCGTRSYFSL